MARNATKPNREVRIGISGWRYPGWRGTFYPPGLAQRAELAYASRRVRTIEINGSFYSLQLPSSYRRWYEESPPGFVFAVKGGRFITHNKKLLDVERPLANFFASGVLALGEKLGPLLWQLPPQLPFDAGRLRGFFDLLPRTTREAVKLARAHDGRLRHAPHLTTDADRPVRHAIEVRHASFVDPSFTRLLRRHDVALCIADTASRWPTIDAVTADFVYVRLHGAKELYVSGYGPKALDEWAGRIASWRGRDVYVYFDNDVRVRAPYDAMNLAARLGQNDLVPFPRKALRVVEAARGVERPRSTWERWQRR
ncbi:MAG TPA: DUF72 domain-containing protein [Polyangiaceae bacterium]